ncbi:hypothetical protein VTN31DRAFT_1116 [Thermomyces dupontii]|uniref:uncharacterized protein n=1 Tax=Talaromyces thermophilus TaxID=28565 RepID=UPI003741F388
MGAQGKSNLHCGTTKAAGGRGNDDGVSRLDFQQLQQTCSHGEGVVQRDRLCKAVAQLVDQERLVERVDALKWWAHEFCHARRRGSANTV